ncbi:hypothetical protein RINTU1_10810 [Candidatus Regiella insecticola]|uniref:Uncharacterized protein n=1 Tax=Candidatus Regiella insecticola TaxID=138073 RepID=A0A6L2ZMD9_9ENTR|nr:hypothetical protein RINTU1_10810 [Candidatus Regiella insecticola]
MLARNAYFANKKDAIGGEIFTVNFSLSPIFMVQKDGLYWPFL